MTQPNRNPAVLDKIRWLTPNPNLPEPGLSVSKAIYELATSLLGQIPQDTPQLTIGLQHLIDAKDALVRATSPDGGAGQVGQ